MLVLFPPSLLDGRSTSGVCSHRSVPKCQKSLKAVFPSCRPWDCRAGPHVPFDSAPLRRIDFDLALITSDSHSDFSEPDDQQTGVTSDRLIRMIHLHHICLRPLTFDEKQAAEAAFAGEPPCAAWSEAGRRVYEGLVAALVDRAGEGLSRGYGELLMRGVR